VIFSDWIPFDASVWSAPFSFFGQNRRNYSIEDTTITDDIINSGTVAVYVKFSGTANNIQPLPVIQSIIQVKNQFLGHFLQPGKIVLFFHNMDDELDPGTIGSGNNYRYVIIPEVPAWLEGWGGLICMTTRLSGSFTRSRIDQVTAPETENPDDIDNCLKRCFLTRDSHDQGKDFSFINEQD
jgi:hypothetical protein